MVFTPQRDHRPDSGVSAGRVQRRWPCWTWWKHWLRCELNSVLSLSSGASCEKLELPSWLEQRLKKEWTQQQVVLLREDRQRKYRRVKFTGRSCDRESSCCSDRCAASDLLSLWQRTPSTCCTPSPTAPGWIWSSGSTLCSEQLTTPGTAATPAPCCSTASPDATGCPGSWETVRWHQTPNTVLFSPLKGNHFGLWAAANGFSHYQFILICSKYSSKPTVTSSACFVPSTFQRQKYSLYYHIRQITAAHSDIWEAKTSE